MAGEEVKSWRNIKFRLFVARDVLLVFLVLQAVSPDKNNTKKKAFIDSFLVALLNLLERVIDSTSNWSTFSWIHLGYDLDHKKIIFRGSENGGFFRIGSSTSGKDNIAKCVWSPYHHVLIYLSLFWWQVIAALGGLAYAMDQDGTFRNSFNDSWDRILSKHPVPFYYTVGKPLHHCVTFHYLASSSLYHCVSLQINLLCIILSV